MLALGLGIVAALGWGSHDYLVRRIATDAEILPRIAVVMVTAALVVAPMTWFSGSGGGDGLGMGLAVAAGLVYFAASYALYAAFARAPARLVAPVIGSYPLPALALAVLVGATVPAGVWGAALVIVLGVGLIAVVADDAAQGRARGAALALAGLACLGMAASFTLGQAATLRLDPYLAPVMSRVAAAAGALVLMVVLRPGLAGLRPVLPVLIAMGGLDGLALSAVLAAGVLPEASHASVASSLFSMITVLLAWAVDGERVRPLQGLGMALVFGGLVWLALA